jgi:hypothetical protein
MWRLASSKASPLLAHLAVERLENRESPSIVHPPYDFWPPISIEPPPSAVVAPRSMSYIIWVKTGPGGGTMGSQA